VIEARYDPRLPNADVDRHQLIQALLNVARNALQSQGDWGASGCAPARAPRQQSGRRMHRLVASVQVEAVVGRARAPGALHFSPAW